MRGSNKLSQVAIVNSKPTTKPYKLTDGAGLYVLVHPNGGKYWRLDYRFNGKRKTKALGVFPKTSLKTAREYRDSIQAILAQGLDPVVKERADAAMAQAKSEEDARTFRVVAMDWHATQTRANKDRTRQYLKARLEKYVFPFIGDKPFRDLKFEDLRSIVRQLESEKKHELAKRVSQIIGQVCIYAKINHWAEHNIADGLNKILERRPKSEAGTFPAITSQEGVAQMLRDIQSFVDSKRSGPTLCAALQLFPHIFLRANELVASRWTDIDFEKRIWRIPAERMKAGKEHDVPLSNQVVAILQHLKKHRSQHSEFVFPSGQKLGHIRGESVNKALHMAGIPLGEMVIHGWRKVWATLAREAGVPDKLVEKQLAHVSGDETAQAYDRSRYLGIRQSLMQWWSNYLDALRLGKPLPEFTIPDVHRFA